MKTNIRKQILSKVVVGIAISLVILTFSPVILHPGKIEPRVLSMPFTLWTSILITIVLVVLTFLVSKLQDKE